MSSYFAMSERDFHRFHSLVYLYGICLLNYVFLINISTNIFGGFLVYHKQNSLEIQRSSNLICKIDTDRTLNEFEIFFTTTARNLTGKRVGINLISVAMFGISGHRGQVNIVTVLWGSSCCVVEEENGEWWQEEEDGECRQEEDDSGERVGMNTEDWIF